MSQTGSMPIDTDKIMAAVGRCAMLKIPLDEASVVVAIALSTAGALFPAGYTDEQMQMCLVAAKGAYLLGKEKGGFVGYG